MSLFGGKQYLGRYLRNNIYIFIINAKNILNFNAVGGSQSM